MYYDFTIQIPKIEGKDNSILFMETDVSNMGGSMVTFLVTLTGEDARSLLSISISGHKIVKFESCHSDEWKISESIDFLWLSEIFFVEIVQSIMSQSDQKIMPLMTVQLLSLYSHPGQDYYIIMEDDKPGL